MDGLMMRSSQERISRLLAEASDLELWASYGSPRLLANLAWRSADDGSPGVENIEH